MSVEFTMIQGDTRYIDIACFHNNNSKLELSMASDINFAIKRYGALTSTPIITKSISSGITIVDTNIASIKINPADTSSIVGKYEYTFTVSDFDGDTFSKSGVFIIQNSNIL